MGYLRDTSFAWCLHDAFQLNFVFQYLHVNSSSKYAHENQESNWSFPKIHTNSMSKCSREFYFYWSFHVKFMLIVFAPVWYCLKKSKQENNFVNDKLYAKQMYRLFFLRHNGVLYFLFDDLFRLPFIFFLMNTVSLVVSTGSMNIDL